MNAVLLISHGSRSSKTKQEISSLIELLRQRLPKTIVEFAFLELEIPSIPKGIDTCAAQGAKKITVLLNFLNAGRHVDQDIPAIIHEAQVKYPYIEFTITEPVGQHPKIADLFIDLIKPASK